MSLWPPWLSCLSPHSCRYAGHGYVLLCYVNSVIQEQIYQSLDNQKLRIVYPILLLEFVCVFFIIFLVRIQS